MQPGDRVIAHFRPPTFVHRDAPGVIERVIYECTVKLDKPIRRRDGREPIEELTEHYLEAMPIGTVATVRGFPRHPGRVTSCMAGFSVKLDARCTDTGCILRYVIPEAALSLANNDNATARGCAPEREGKSMAAKRGKMGKAGSELFHKGTAADALAEVSGGKPAGADHKGATPATSPLQADPLTVTTFRLRRSQLYWLTDVAEHRRRARGSGRPDASEVIRELIDRAMVEASKAEG